MFIVFPSFASQWAQYVAYIISKWDLKPKLFFLHLLNHFKCFIYPCKIRSVFINIFIDIYNRGNERVKVYEKYN